LFNSSIWSGISEDATNGRRQGSQTKDGHQWPEGHPQGHGEECRKQSSNQLTGHGLHLKPVLIVGNSCQILIKHIKQIIKDMYLVCLICI
jgi:hypothetical protein